MVRPVTAFILFLSVVVSLGINIPLSAADTSNIAEASAGKPLVLKAVPIEL